MSPQLTLSAVIESLTVNLSLGARPAYLLVKAASAPLSARCPSPRRTECSMSGPERRLRYTLLVLRSDSRTAEVSRTVVAMMRDLLQSAKTFKAPAKAGRRGKVWA